MPHATSLSAPRAGDLLRTWEAAGVERLPARALMLLRAADARVAWDDLRALTVGARDAALLDLREALFGRSLECVARCTHCGEPLEFTMSTDAIRAPVAPPGASLALEQDGYAVTFRAPTAGDLLHLAATDPVAAERELLARCVLSARTPRAEVDAEDLPAPIGEAVARRMAELDPQADTVLDLRCAACGERDAVAFDIAAHLWLELDAWSRRLLREVHTLASTYGWHEADILAMSAPRRERYLELIAG